MNDVQAFDLGEYAASLLKNKQTRELAKRILSYLDVASAHADLVLAQELCYVVNENLVEEEHSLAVSAALIQQVVLLYARAMIVGSSKKKHEITGADRRTFSYTSKMTEEEKRRHVEIDRIRNGAIAHFNRDTMMRDRLWAREALVYVAPPIAAEDDVGKIGAITQRIGFDHELFQIVIDQVATGLRLLEEALPKRNAEAWEAFAEVMADPKAGAALGKLPIDLRPLFSSEEMLADFVGRGEGSGKLHRDHVAQEPPKNVLLNPS